MSKCNECGYRMCLCVVKGSEGTAPSPKPGCTCSQCYTPPVNVINVEFRSDARRMANLEARIAELEKQVAEHVEHPVVTWGGYPYPASGNLINWTCP